MFVKLGMHKMYLIYVFTKIFDLSGKENCSHIIFSQEKKQLNQPTKPEGHRCPQLLCFFINRELVSGRMPSKRSCVDTIY